MLFLSVLNCLCVLSKVLHCTRVKSMWPRCLSERLRLWPGTHRTRLTYCAAVTGQLCKHTTAGKSAASWLQQPLVTSINITHWWSTGAPVHDYAEISTGRRADGWTNIHTPRANGHQESNTKRTDSATLEWAGKQRFWKRGLKFHLWIVVGGFDRCQFHQQHDLVSNPL